MADEPLATVDFTERATRFVRELRDRGVTVTPGDSIVAVRALCAVDLTDRADVYLALRTVLVSRASDLAIFDDLFREWWKTGARGHAARRDATHPRARPNSPAVHAPTDDGRSTTTALSLTRWASSTAADDAGGSIRMPAPSARDAVGGKDFSTYTAEDLGAIERVAARIARRLRARPSRRWKSASSGARVDLRRSVRLSLKTGGDPIELARRERKPRRTRLVVLCDVSGSMDIYSRFLLQVLYALQHAFERVESFAFSTRLVCITDALLHDAYREALDALGRLPGGGGGWSGGTKIGACLAAFHAEWPRLVDQRTVVVILSDGWDTGAPELLGDTLREIRARAGRVVWLNPLLGSPSYQPLTRGIQAALPHVDVFAPAHDLASLERLASHLSL